MLAERPFKQRISHPPLQGSKLLKACKIIFLLGVFLLFSQISFRVTHPQLPSIKSPLNIYSNQTSDDLKILFKKALSQSKTSCFLQIYGCTDPELIHEMINIQKKGVDLRIFYDPSGSGPLNKKIPSATPLKCRGLMHKKILILDHEQVFIGSANFTPTSLRMHDNIVVGMIQKDLAAFIEYGTDQHLDFSIENQKAEFWHLPDLRQQCLTRLLSSIDEAKNKIHLALFTLTHPQILNALIKAHERGIQILLAIDFYSHKGASKQAIERLKNAGISPIISSGGKLLHYKWALFDEKTLFLGSANWTQSAFQNNEDCLLVLHDLKPAQKKYFSKLWKEIEKK